MYYEYHFFLTTSMMPFVTSVSKKITAISKTDSQDFSQPNPRDQNGGIHRVLRGLETWPRVKAQQNSTSESGWRSGISGDSVGGGNWYILSSYGIYTKEVRQKNQKAGRNREKWYHSPTKQAL